MTLTRAGWDTTGGDLEGDDGNRFLKVLHDRVTDATPIPDGTVPARIRDRVKQSGRAVICNLTAWHEMEDGRQWTWWSLWSPHQLAAFSSIEFLANGFDESVTYALIRSVWPEIEWYQTHLTSARAFMHRNLVVEYYADKHVASRSFFESDEGIDHLDRIARHVAATSAGYIWTANDAHADKLTALDDGAKLRPHQAGSNKWDHINDACIIYSAKPSAESRAVMNLLSVDSDTWTRSYEYEAILQFACRTSVRRTDSADDVTIRVYDRDQADYLANYFRRAPHLTVTVQCVDLGYAHHARTTSGVPARVLTPEEAEAKAAATRARKARNEQARRDRKKADELATSVIKKRGMPKGWRKS